MGQVHSLALGAAFALALGALYIARSLRSPQSQLGLMPGPGRGHPLFGHIVALKDDAGLRARWVQAYGRIVNIPQLFNRPELLITDLTAMAHVLNRTDVYYKPVAAKALLSRTLGVGLLLVEDEQHRAQRRTLNPAFGPSQLRDLTGIFLDKANEFRDFLLAQVPGKEGVRMNIMRPMSGCTLNIIGLAGFGYDFNALAPTGAPDELALAFRDLFEAPVRWWELVLEFVVPAYRALPTQRNTATRSAMAIMHRIGKRLINERKEAARVEAAQGEKLDDARPRDLLSLLVRANTTTDPKHRLSDAEVLDQIPTFLIAGHETTSTLLSWTLYRLSLNPSVQAALRAECRAHPLPDGAHGNAPLSAGALATLDHRPLLDAVLRETLRLDAPVPNVGRVAAKADSLPLSAPVTDTTGRVHHAIPIMPGDAVLCPIRLLTASEELWGPTAASWDPNRWIDNAVPEAVKSLPNLHTIPLSFGSGPRSCIGYLFSLYEAKIILHALVSTFAFELAVPAKDIHVREGIITRPVLESNKDKAQLPLLVRRAGEE